MQRQDRINFPEINTEEIWGTVNRVEETYSSPDRINAFREEAFSSPPDFYSRTPILISPIPEIRREEDVRSSSNYFRDREFQGLITPAKTPSDILLRGPLYESSGDDPQSCPESVGDSPCRTSTGSTPTQDILENRIQFHRERQQAIRQSIAEYERKMSELLHWHQDQETKYMQKLVNKENMAPRVRGRSKLSEKLYAAIARSADSIH